MRCWFIALVLRKALRLCRIGFKMQLGRTDTVQSIIFHPIGCWERASVQGAACHGDPICGKITSSGSHRIFLKLLILTVNFVV